MGPLDLVEVEVVGSAAASAGVLDNFTSIALKLDLSSPSEANFEIGDDGTFAELAQALGPGQRYRVRLNGQVQLSGRVESNDVPLDAGAGSVARFTIRTIL